MRNSYHGAIFSCAVLAVTSVAMAQTPEWTAAWHGIDRPGPKNLPYTTGWPADPGGFEQYDPANAYSGNGPRYAEGANVDDFDLRGEKRRGRVAHAEGFESPQFFDGVEREAPEGSLGVEGHDGDEILG